MAAVKVIVLVAMIGMASACMNKNRGGPRPKIDSGSVDIPISLKFQQGPIPQASFSVGVASKMNQHVGNGVYKQTQFNSGFKVNGAAVPVLDSSLNVQGISADVDTHMSHDNQVVYLDHDPMRTTKVAPQFDNYQAFNGQVEPEVVVEAIEVDRPLRRDQLVNQEPARHVDNKKRVGELKLEYFIAILTVGCVCFFALLVVAILIAKKRRRVIEKVIVAQPSRKVSSVPSYTSEVISDMKPPRYDIDSKKDAATTPENKF